VYGIGIHDSTEELISQTRRVRELLTAVVCSRSSFGAGADRKNWHKLGRSEKWITQKHDWTWKRLCLVHKLSHCIMQKIID
jgi:hypothetical protein